MRHCNGTMRIGRYVSMAMLEAFMAGFQAMRVLAFYKGQRPHADQGDVAMDIALGVIFLFSGFLSAYRITDNHWLSPEDPQ